MTDPMAAMRKREEAKIKSMVETRGLTQAERVERSFSPDAKKVRDLVKAREWHSLPELAAVLVKVVTERKTRERIEAALDAYVSACAEYFNMEARPSGDLIAWMGPAVGHLPALPPGAPEHKLTLAATWNELLAAVNEAACVGVLKASRYRPIRLQVDLDAEATPEDTWQ